MICTRVLLLDLGAAPSTFKDGTASPPLSAASSRDQPVGMSTGPRSSLSSSFASRAPIESWARSADPDGEASSVVPCFVPFSWCRSRRYSSRSPLGLKDPACPPLNGQPDPSTASRRSCHFFSRQELC